jgi:hypothetical protein
MKVKKYLTEAVSKKVVAKYKDKFRVQYDAFHATANLPESPFRCMHLKNKPIMSAEQCTSRAAKPEFYDDKNMCKGCHKFEHLMGRDTKRKKK